MTASTRVLLFSGKHAIERSFPVMRCTRCCRIRRALQDAMITMTTTTTTTMVVAVVVVSTTSNTAFIVSRGSNTSTEHSPATVDRNLPRGWRRYSTVCTSGLSTTPTYRRRTRDDRRRSVASMCSTATYSLHLLLPVRALNGKPEVVVRRQSPSASHRTRSSRLR